MSVSSKARQFAIKQTIFGPMLMVRTSLPDYSPGFFEWSKWRKARLSEIQMVSVKLIELQVN